MIDEFYKYLLHEKGCSPLTVTAYENDLNEFRDYLREDHDDCDPITEVNRQVIRSWIVHLSEDKQFEAASINRKLSTLKSFYKFLVKKKKVKSNPAELIGSLKQKKRLPEFVSEKDMKELFSRDEFFPDDLEGRRNKLIFELFYATGMRVSELTNLKLSDYDEASGLIRVLGKGNKERQVPVTPPVVKALKEYLIYRDELNAETDALLLTSKGKPAYTKLIYRLVRNYLNQVSTIEKRSPHVIRHTFATHLLNKGADLQTIKSLLGHADLSATEKYTHNTFEKLKEVYSKAHPRS